MFRRLLSLLILLLLVSSLAAQRGIQLDLSHPLNRGLAGYWSFDEGDGGQLSDLSLNKNHGTLTNMDPATDWVGGRAGGFGALDFDKTNDYVDTNTPVSGYRASSEGTMSAWCKARSHPVSTGAVYQGGCLIGDTGGYCSIVHSTVGGTSDMHCYNWDGSVDSVALSVDLNVWSHYVWVLDNGTLYGYRDGVLQGSTASGNTQSLAGEIHIGQGNISYRVFDGQIDDVRIYNRALSAAEVRQLYILEQQQYTGLRQRGKPPAIVSVAAPAAPAFKPQAILLGKRRWKIPEELGTVSD